MFNSEALEVGIGMAFLFLAVSVICTAAKEWLEGIFKWRAMDLERALRTLLADNDGSLTGQLLRHPLLFSLFPGRYDPRQLRRSRFTPGQGSLHMRLSQRRNLPSYIPAAQFATALIDSVLRGPVDAEGRDAEPLSGLPLSIEALRESALRLASPHLRRAVLTAIDHSDGDLVQLRANVEQWFNGTMDRASGWYKRRTQAVLFGLGIAIAAALNIDALHVMQRLTADKAFREVVVKEAVALQPPAEAASAAYRERIAEAKGALERVGMPIGWRTWTSPSGESHWVPRQLCAHDPAPVCARTQWLDRDWLMVLCGWLVTAFAVMLGAPFWFDVLNKFMVIRSTVKPHEKSPEVASEDKQSPAVPAARARMGAAP